MLGVHGGQRRASPPANQLIADIKQLPKEGRHSYLITKEQGLCFVYYLCNKLLSSIANLFVNRRCRFDPLSSSQCSRLHKQISNSQHSYSCSHQLITHQPRRQKYS